MRKILIAAAALAAIGAVLVPTLSGARARHSTGQRSGGARATRRTEAAYRRTARRLAARELRGAYLPAGAGQVPHDPSTGHQLAAPPLEYGFRNRTALHRFYLVPGSDAALIARLLAHPPPGLRQTGSGTSGKVGGTVTEQSVEFTPRRLPRGIYAAQVSYAVAPAAGGRYALRIDSEADWLAPRPAWERVPAGVHAVQVVAGGIATKRTYPVATVTAPGAVRKLVRLVNRAQILQPGFARSCPGLSDGYPLIELRFSAGPGQPAEATIREDGCDDMSFTAGRRTGPLLNEPVPLIEALHRLGLLPRCTGLTGRSGPIRRNRRAAGGGSVMLTVRNRGPHPCAISGRPPRVRLLSPAGRPLPTVEHTSPGVAPPMLLTPSWSAQSYLSWPGRGPDCRARRAGFLRLRIDGARGVLKVPLGSARSPASPCGGRIAVSALLG